MTINSEKNRCKMNKIDISISKAATIAAVGLLLITILAPIADFVILQKLIVPNDSALTTKNIIASERLFRVGILFFLIVSVLDIIVAWAIYVFLIPVNKNLSLLAAWFRIVYASILAVVTIYLINVLHLISKAEYLSTFIAEELQARIMLSVNMFRQGWEFGLIIFGVHLLLIGYLILKAGYMKRILGSLIILASLGYMIDGFGNLLSVKYNLTISMFTFIGEVILIFWLLIKGRKIQVVNGNE